MSDDRLFVSNNAIGRKWYFLNLLILAAITYGTYFLFNNLIIPNITSEDYQIITPWIMYFFMAVYAVTLLSLIDRRLFDIFETRDAKGYRRISVIITLTVIFQLFTLYCNWKNPVLPVSNETLFVIAGFLDTILGFIVFLIIFIKGKISNLTYEQYKKKTKYK